jgi:hypothetical protein
MEDLKGFYVVASFFGNLFLLLHLVNPLINLVEKEK